MKELLQVKNCMYVFFRQKIFSITTHEDSFIFIKVSKSIVMKSSQLKVSLIAEKMKTVANYP